ncbi:hypothetical protein [Lactobacillus sp. LL6]|uniref:hypothetical protein n=1 Tax=Lactobacillus sp. LL6 TaxID=2596827 RepID=UPI0011861916|nr:hypothetical protein [Lactobacillus sp. LL6]TSO26903.1 hypothetical protein FOD82_07740 [Lactobacillus sp. LL6]
MKKGSLWLVSVLLVLLGLMVYWDHSFKDFGKPAMIVTTILIIVTILIAIFGTFSTTFNSWIGAWWVVPDGILFGFASMLDYASAAKICCFALLMIVCIYVETKLYDDKRIGK